MAKGELVFIGIGLHDEKDISLKGLEAAKSCDEVFAEFYTSTIPASCISKLERLIEKPIQVLERKEVEEGKIILDSAMERKVGFLVVGDPMAATTHVSLRVSAEKRGIKTKLIHSSSVFTAIPGLLGLQHYKFGRTTSLVYPQDSYFPLSPYSVIEENLSRGLHTLVLLDINREKGMYMSIREGIELLFDMEEKVGHGVIKEDMLMCGVARAGSDNPLVRAAPARILKGIDFGPPLHTIVIPGQLHFVEEEALQVLAGYQKRR
ncbi:MAG TPA: diphthine synthase [Thermoplasmatales archaeon]|nr:diphthine synthase [Thermoplasmatales archaeon]